MAFAQVGLLLAGIAVPAGWGAQKPDGVREGCVFVKVLENPTFRARYKKSLANARVFDQDGGNDSQAMYGTIVKASISTEDGKLLGSLDSFSTGCVSCHSGIVSRKDTLNFRNDPETRMQMISGKHPIGMNYERYTRYRDSLKKVDELDPKLVLVGGKVSCVTCHDLLNPEKDHLVRNDMGKDLCSECHTM
jgi:hypothetical protein